MKIACMPLLLLFVTIAAARQKNKTQPFIIKGQFSNCQDNFLFLSFEDLNGQRYTDTIHLDKNGNFYLKTWKVKAPVQANIGSIKTQIYNLNVAPGFDLTLTANVSDMLTLLKTKKISGKGAECNEYRFIADSIFCTTMEKMQNGEMQNMSDTAMLAYFNEENRLYDSIATAVFSKKPGGDKNFDFCRQVTGYEGMFTKLSRLFFIIDWFSYDKEKANRFIKDNFDNQVLNNIFKNEYMLSGFYKDFMSNQYLHYLIDPDYEKDPGLRDNELYVLEIINKDYKGLIKEYAIYNNLKNMIGACQSFIALEARKRELQPFIAGLNGGFRKSFYNHLSAQENILDKIKAGMPAPAFTLQSITGATNSLADYKGKVVYIDVWASWCTPCREEIPKLKALYEKYKNDDRIVFLSIAVADQLDKWKKAVEDDKATWPQLFDKGNTIQTAYRAYTIPKFILIDKQGNIVNPDAPRPGMGKQIEKLLQEEMAK